MKSRFCISTITRAMLVASAISLAACNSNNDSSAEPDHPVQSAGVQRLEILGKVPAFGGRSFGSVGAYEVVVARLHGRVDPKSARNRTVVDLEHAPTNAAGLVEYTTDVLILKPSDMAKADGTLLYEVLNRGNKARFAMYTNGGDGSFGSTGPTGGLALERGYVLVWSGWQSDVRSTVDPASGNGLLAASFPTASLPNNTPIQATVVDEFLLDGTAGLNTSAMPTYASTALTFDAPLTHTPATQNQKIVVSVRQKPSDAPTVLDPSQYTFKDARTLTITRAPGFDLAAPYTVQYVAEAPPVAGLSGVSIRDLISMLKYEASDQSGNSNPLAVGGSSAIKRTIGFGASQSGRFLKDFIYHDMNLDQKGRIVFDGAVPVLSGGKRGSFFHRFAAPGRTSDLQHENRSGFEGAQFPFSYSTLFDPVTGKTDGILEKCTQSESCPKIIHMDTDWEQWQQTGSLLVTDTTGRPAPLPQNVRAYLISSSQHGTGAGVAAGTFADNQPTCSHYANPVNYRPVERALLVAMEDWLKKGTEPPASKYPADAASGRVSLETLLSQYPQIPGYTFPAVIGQPQVIDFGKEAFKVIASPAPYPVLPLRVNADGNSYDGIVVPEVAVPIATYTPAAVRKAGFAPGQLCGIYGASYPFAKTLAERTATGDPRLSIAERYASDDDYRARIKAVADSLVAQRLMLPADADAYSAYQLPR